MKLLQKLIKIKNLEIMMRFLGLRSTWEPKIYGKISQIVLQIFIIKFFFQIDLKNILRF